MGCSTQWIEKEKMQRRGSILTRSQGTADRSTDPDGQSPQRIDVDPYRSIVFPNHSRRFRRNAGMTKLLQLAAKLPHIPYVRLSKIERGEVVAKAEELVAIGKILNVRAEDFLIDIDSSGFAIADWAQDMQDWEAVDPDEDRLAVMLAAALRALRDRDPKLTIAAIERDYGIAPVILSRLENAQKPLNKWNRPTLEAVFRLFGVTNSDALRTHIAALATRGALNDWLGQIANPALREEKTRARVNALRQQLDAGEGLTPKARPQVPQPAREIPALSGEHSAPRGSSLAATINPAEQAIVRLVPVFGAPLTDGLLARTPTGESIEAPRNAGPRSYGLRVCRPTLGPGLPGRATVVVDPDRFPSAGGLAVVSEKAGVRIVMVTLDRGGGMVGYSQNPDMEVALDRLDPTALAAVIGAVYE